MAIKMNPINSFKRWLLDILVPFLEGDKKRKELDERTD